MQGVGLGRRARSLCDQTGYAKARGFGHNFTSPARELRVSRKAAANSHVTGTLESRLDLYVHLARICLPRHRNLRVATQLPAAAAPPTHVERDFDQVENDRCHLIYLMTELA